MHKRQRIPSLFLFTTSFLIALVLATASNAQPISGSLERAPTTGLSNSTGIVTGFGCYQVVRSRPDGKITLVGQRSTAGADAGVGHFCAVCVNANSTLPNPFGGAVDSKVLLTAMQAGSSTSDVALQPNSKIIRVGRCANGNDSVGRVVRMSASGRLDPGYDGDAQIYALEHGLIVAPALLGFSGDAVLQGISFTPDSTRTTWAQNRGYLTGSCQMAL